MNNTRHLSIFDPSEFKKRAVHIFGCGNVGSHTAEAIVRMGFENIFLYDFDIVEEVNISTQNFTSQDEKLFKVQALSDNLSRINPRCTVTMSTDRIEEDTTLPIDNTSMTLICGFDSIEARQLLQKLLIAQGVNTPVIDGRLGKEQVEVLFSKNPTDWDTVIEEHMKVVTACTDRYISYTPLMSASLIANTLKRLCAKEDIAPKVLFEFVSQNYLSIKQ